MGQRDTTRHGGERTEGSRRTLRLSRPAGANPPRLTIVRIRHRSPRRCLARCCSTGRQVLRVKSIVSRICIWLRRPLRARPNHAARLLRLLAPRPTLPAWAPRWMSPRGGVTATSVSRRQNGPRFAPLGLGTTAAWRCSPTQTLALAPEKTCLAGLGVRRRASQCTMTPLLVNSTLRGTGQVLRRDKGGRSKSKPSRAWDLDPGYRLKSF